MFQEIITYINTLDPALIYLVLFLFSFIENFFPPSPSDIVVVFGATLIAHTSVGLVPILAVTTAGSSIGFIVMYFIGEYFGENILRKGKLKFINKGLLEKTDRWFHKYGYKIILINRFMPGTRAVVSFFTGVHRLKRSETFLFAGISSLFWNILLILLGIFLGNNIELIDKYLKTYSNIILLITLLIAIFFLVKYFLNKKRTDEIS